MTRLLDLFCGAGGAAVGYHRAGFDDITGVDIAPQPHYPFRFLQADALEYLAEHGAEYDAIHASPPCQSHSPLRFTNKIIYLDLIPDIRQLLKIVNKPWVIENVEGAPLIDPIILCGTQFNLKVFRHRKFESSIKLVQPEHISHKKQGCHVGTQGKEKIDPSGFVTVVGNFKNISYSQKAMGGLNWMTQGELAQAIPPAYTEYIGRYLLEATHD